ncbi:MAG: Ig-like domain-containing protein [Candidatus Berkelbacteria bacterium]
MRVKEKIQSFLKLAMAFILAIALFGLTGYGLYYASSPLVRSIADKLNSPTKIPERTLVLTDADPETSSSSSASVVIDIKPVAPSDQTKKEIAATPPAYTASKSTVTAETKKNSDGTVTTKVASGNIDVCEKNMPTATVLNISDIPYVDETGSYPALGDALKNYLNNNLYHSSEYQNLKGIVIVDVGSTTWSGMYCGTYSVNSRGIITAANGFIVINVDSFRSSSIFSDIAKVVFSHEYGHHFTLYYKWTRLNLPNTERFPDQYYSLRPLSKTGTAIDYSLGWQNCEVEVLAEDYSYFFSGYNYMNAQMVSSWGYPSSATKSWILALPTISRVTESSASSTVSVSISSAVSSSAAPVADAIVPVIIFVSPTANPYSWIAGNLQLSIRATDNISVAKVEVYIDDELALTTTQSVFTATWPRDDVPAGTYQLRAVATDNSGNFAEIETSIIKL